MVGDSQNHHDAGLVCIEELSEGVYIDIYLLTGITKLSDVTYDPWAVCPQPQDFELPYDSEDFQECWHETITLVLDSKEFHVPKRLASARLPYVQTYLNSAFSTYGKEIHQATENFSRKNSRIELGIEAPSSALDSLLGIIMGGQQYFEDWWDKNDYGGSLELIKVADFLGCSELVQIIEDLLIKELQVDQCVEESLMVCYSSGFPNLQRLKCACLHTAAFEVLVRLCLEAQFQFPKLFQFCWWWQLTYFWNFHPENWGRWTHFDSYCSNGLVQPPTSNLLEEFFGTNAAPCFDFHCLITLRSAMQFDSPEVLIAKARSQIERTPETKL